MTLRIGAEEQPVLRAGRSSSRRGEIRKTIKQDQVAVLASVALPDMNDHPAFIDIIDRETCTVGIATARTMAKD